jgi:Zn-dependent peptidase ImmA (M78 family)
MSNKNRQKINPLAKEHSNIPRERESAIIALAEYVGSEHQAALYGGTKLDAILKEKGIKLCFGDYEDLFDGLIVFEDGHYFIHCNRLTGNHENGIRTRFTIAHELGHYFIDEHRIALRNNHMPSLGERLKGDILIEQEADLFASRLLLPGAVFQKALKKAEPGLVGIISLAEKFNVSVRCAGLRYISEDPVSSCLAFWAWDEQLRWKWYSRSLWNAGIRKLKPKPIVDGAISQCIKDGTTQQICVKQSHATINYLFQVDDGAHYHAICSEEAAALGEHGVLSLTRAQDGYLKPLAEVIDSRLNRW